MAKKHQQSLDKSVNFAKIVHKLKCPTLIKHFVESTNEHVLSDFYRIMANLLYNEKFTQSKVIKRKIPKLRKMMAPYKKQWIDITKYASKNPKKKKKFFVGSGNILSIISSVLPLLLTLL